MIEPQCKSHSVQWNIFKKFSGLLLYGVFLMVGSSDVSDSRFLVKELPGLIGELPFTLETGYIGVGDSDDIQLFYYFFESERDPKNDPLILWLTGGPGCSGLSAILYEIGPFTINYENSTLEKPMLTINPYSWTKEANIIFVDQPAGTGFSYAKTQISYITNDTLATMHAYHFMRKWLMDHPKFLTNPFYVAGDSYSGIVVPMMALRIYNGNEVGEEPNINIKGYIIGNPATDMYSEFNSKIESAHRLALISDAIYKSAKENCHGNYLIVDPNNTLCIHDLQVVNKCLERIDIRDILEPSCDTTYTRKYDIFRRGLTSLPHVKKQWCRDDNYLYAAPWANSREVREALHIHEDFKEIEWVLCNASLSFVSLNTEPISYTYNVKNVIDYHRRLSYKQCRALVYSGDHDMVVPYFSTLKWLESLNFLVIDDWKPWFVEEQVAGYTIKLNYNYNYNLTFVTVKGGGHTAPEFKPKECLSMIMGWLSNADL
ncbi:serine carboxypeptidase-like 13 isoform X1 [Lactuca sativa]|uniref:serine carboxypeptidase-like 13 isoform X1 n=1 Tax=Lactuca sativa TaxID=4236 RepID=UPI0022AE9F37|nr:serine carboxypeptidase-like 13 isoform X1 [Lactuca sativa]